MLLIWIIRLIHYLVVAFFVLAPFTNDQRILTLHLIGVPFLLLHWVTNQSTCALTEVEKFISGKAHDEETFIGSIVAPVYKFQSPENCDMVLWLALVLLWLYTFHKVRKDDFSLLRAAIRQMFDTLRF